MQKGAGERNSAGEENPDYLRDIPVVVCQSGIRLRLENQCPEYRGFFRVPELSKEKISRFGEEAEPVQAQCSIQSCTVIHERFPYECDGKFLGDSNPVLPIMRDPKTFVQPANRIDDNPAHKSRG